MSVWGGGEQNHSKGMFKKCHSLIDFQIHTENL